MCESFVAMLHVPILAYHTICESQQAGPNKPGLYVTPTQFRRQLFFLRALGYRNLSFDQFIAALEEPAAQLSKAFLVTFDDGYAGIYRSALPIMKHYGVRGTVFLIAEDFAQQSVPRERAFPILLPDQVRSLLQSGWDLGSHSMTHPNLTKLSITDLRVEIAESKRILQDRFQVCVSAFAYPFGFFSPTISELVSRTGYLGAMTTEFGSRHSTADRYQLKRISVGSAQNLPQFCYRLLRSHKVVK